MQQTRRATAVVAAVVAAVLTAQLLPAGAADGSLLPIDLPTDPATDPLPTEPTPTEPTPSEDPEPPEPPPPPPPPPPSVGVYRRLGSWIDIYDEHTHDRPWRTMRTMRRRGVRTVYIETANYHRPKRRPVYRPRATGRLIEAAHANGMRVVAWYLPSFANLRRDRRRTMAAINFRSANGHAFDSFAMDIEATTVRSIARRNRRMLKLSRRVRAAVGGDYPLGAIVPDSDARYWYGFPYRAVARHYDVFLPMAYFTYRTSGPRRVARFTRRNVRVVQRRTGDPDQPVHVIGGLAEPATLREVGAFARAASRHAVGGSLYDFETTRRRQWRRLRRIN